MIHRNRLLNGASALALLAGLGFYTHTAAATIIGFDDLTDTSLGFGGTPIANGYQGFNWTNWNVLNGADSVGAFGPNGAAAGTVSPPNVAYTANSNSTNLEIFSTGNNSQFTLNTFDLTAVWRDDLSVTVKGLLNGVVEDTIKFTPLATAATLETFNWSGINQVSISATGGPHHVGYSGSGNQVAIDNLTVTTGVPEPSTLAIVGAGLAGLGIARRRRRKAA